MQFTVDTRNATAFELTALAEFVQKLASVAPPQEARSVADFYEAPVTREAVMAELSTVSVNDGPDSNSGNAPAAGAPELAPTAGPAPEIPPAPGAIPQAPAVAPVSTAPTDVPAVPTSVPAAPALPAAAAPAETPADLDSAGCPWSPLIHTSNKATIGDGTWRKKPGVDPAYFESVRAELMGNAPVAAESTTPPAVPAAPAIEPAAPVHEAPALLTGNDVMARAMEVQMADASKGAALYQGITAAGIVGGPMNLPATTDQDLLKAALDAINAVAAQ